MKSFMLLNERITWKGLATLTCPRLRHHDVRVRVAYPRQTGGHRSNYSKPAWAVPLADLPEIERLRSAGASWGRIRETEYPDKATWQVRYACIKQMGASIQRQRVQGFNIASTEIADIKRLRHEGKTWDQIRDLKYPGRNSTTVRIAVARRENGAGAYYNPSIGKITSAEMADIKRLRHEGKTWDQITDMKYSGNTPEALRVAVLRQDNGAGKYRRLSIGKITSAEMADIKRLRHEGKTWDHIRDMKYSGNTTEALRIAVVRQSGEGGEFRNPKVIRMLPADVTEIKRLRLEGKTWEQIRDMKFPGRPVIRVRENFLSHDDSRSELRKQPPLKLPPAEVADIHRLLAAGKPWKEISALKYPKRNCPAVRRAFLKQYGSQPSSSASSTYEESSARENRS